jgi:polar amino acid transport system substrate-binding protein
LKEPFTHEPLGWAVRKGDPDFLNWLENFLYQVKNDGTYDALYSKWFEGTAWLSNVNGQ